MANRGPHLCPRTTTFPARASLWPVIAVALLCLHPAAAQKSKPLTVDPSALRPPELKDHFLLDRLPEKPTIPPFATIPLDPLDFAAPNPVYIGHRYTMASLDFLDENHLLFTFRVPGLIRRTPGQDADPNEHKIRAVVLAIPSGKITAEDFWVLHGRDRYVWPLKDGHFLLRDGNVLSEGDAFLNLRPLLSFPGQILTVAMDPDEQYVITNSREPVPGAAKTEASADESSDDAQSTGVPDLVLRIFRRETGKVLNVTRVHIIRDIPINSRGILQALHGYSNQWTVELDGLKGGSTTLARVVSQCTPTLQFIADDELVATTCKPEGGYRLTGITTSGQLLWQDTTSSYTVWPELRKSASGLRFLRETLAVTREINAFWSLDRTAVKAQRVRVFDAADGHMAFEATADPVLDAGGNAAISPSGRRVALLSGGNIQIFNLPAPPGLPPSATHVPPQ
jgi:hypothetical protein